LSDIHGGRTTACLGAKRRMAKLHMDGFGSPPMVIAFQEWWVEMEAKKD